MQALRLRLVDHDGSSTRAPISSVAPSHAPRSTQSGRGRGPFARHRAHAQVASSELQFFEFFGQVKMCNLFNLPQVHTINLVHVQLYTDACFIACFMPILFETMEKLFEIMFFFWVCLFCVVLVVPECDFLIGISFINSFLILILFFLLLFLITVR